MKKYTKEQIKRSKELANILYGKEAMEASNRMFMTFYGMKSSTGIINTILVIMFGEDKESKEYKED